VKIVPKCKMHSKKRKKHGKKGKWMTLPQADGVFKRL
jgi:hypothetical protein